jgi:hypothetical protein
MRPFSDRKIGGGLFFISGGFVAETKDECERCGQPIEAAGHKCATGQVETKESTPRRSDYRGTPWWLRGKLETKAEGDDADPQQETER